ncbi:amino acid permease [Streptomyces sp. NPDC056883]|uniref:amino acid permease n=1 Tax=Streptomyces sp. NPDC056883 TaxID=3345959 RepID=UPI0036B364B9
MLTTRPSPAAPPQVGARPHTKYLTVSTLGLMTAASIVTSLRGLPMMAKEEMTMFAYIGFSTLLFLVPAGLVAAELGGAFGHRAGGLYVWVGEAFGKPTGFVAIFLTWVQNIVWYPTGLTFAATAAAFAIGRPDLAANNVYVGLFIVVAFCLCTGAALVSTHFASKVTKYGFLLGTVVPGVVLIALCLAWLVTGHAAGWSTATDHAVAVVSHGHSSPRWLPYLTGLSSLSFLAGILLNFAGVESQAVHATELKDAKRGYPVVIMVAAGLSFVIFTLGALAVAGILPYKDIDINTGVFDALTHATTGLMHVGWPVQVLAVLICYGALGGVLAWITGPSRGVLATARDGLLPPFMQKTNKAGVQKNILLVQVVVVALLSSLYLVVDNVSTVFFLISAMAVSLYIIVYMLLYASAIRLRYTQPDLPRAFRIPGGKPGIWLVGGLGFLAVAFAFVLAFVPPSQLPIGSPGLYVGLVAAGAVIFSSAPLILERFKKPSWMPKEAVPEGEEVSADSP